MRVGLGYDIHRVATGRRLVLGGVEIEEAFGLEGHSDADVVIHALMDALLGAAGQRDIGTYFPAGDKAYQGISSLMLLQKVREIITNMQYRVVNVDIVLVAERPRIAPFVDAMRERMSEVLGVDVSQIGLKATTNEQVGAEGRGEAMSAQAVALLQHM